MTAGLRDVEECERIRRAEMETSAALFGGAVEYMGLPDLFYSFNGAGRTRVIEEWAGVAGGRDALVDRFAAIIRQEQPDLLFTFDPRHGSSCHAGHLAVAELVVEALRRIPEGERPAVWLEQTDDIEERSPENQQIISGLGYVGWPDTAGETVWYDATRPLRNGRTAHDYVLLVRRAHASQFPEEASGEKVATASGSARRTPLAPLPDAILGEYCTALALERPTLDIPENSERIQRLLESSE